MVASREVLRLVVRLARDLRKVDPNLRPEIRAAHANHRSQAAETQPVILFRVARNYVAAPAPHQLVQPQVVEVAAVRQVDESALRTGGSEQLRQRVTQAESRSVRTRLGPGRVAQRS